MEKKNINLNDSEVTSNSYLISLSQAAESTGYTAEHLNLLCRKKVLKGIKVGRNWHTTKEWLNEFLYLPKKSQEGKIYQRRKSAKTISLEKEERVEEINENPDLTKINGFEDSASIGLNISSKPEISENVNLLSFEKAERKLSWQKTFAISFSTLFISLFLFFGISFWKFLDTKNSLIDKGIPNDLAEDTFLFMEKPGVVKGEEAIAEKDLINPLSGSVATSENYKVEQMSFGGSNITLANMDNAPVGIYDVKSETFNSKDGKQAQILLSWKTSKLTISEINYSKDGSEISKTLQEKYYGFNHNAVLTNLDMATAYNYEIKIRDRWGNEISSGKFRSYTGSKMVSVFELIMKAINDTFGWAVNR